MMKLIELKEHHVDEALDAVGHVDPEAVFCQFLEGMKSEEPPVFKLTKHHDNFNHYMEMLISYMRHPDGGMFMVKVNLDGGTPDYPGITFGPHEMPTPWLRKAIQKLKTFDPCNYIQKNQIIAMGFSSDLLSKSLRLGICGKAHPAFKKNADAHLFAVRNFAFAYMYAYTQIYCRQAKRNEDYAEPMEYTTPVPLGDDNDYKVLIRDDESAESLRDDESGRKHRNHPVRGHWAYKRNSGEDTCDHLFEEVGRDGKRQRCDKCGKLRWWVNSHRRGNETLGVMNPTGHIWG